MRISDWSSDVCSSDLGRRIAGNNVGRERIDPLMRVEAADQEFDRTKPVGNEPQLGRFFLLRNRALIREAGVRRVIIPQETEQWQKGHVGRREVILDRKSVV